MATVFLSYAHEDSAVVDVIAASLRAAGIEVWRDRERLYAGQRWPKALGEAIAAADGLVLLWSSRSAGSPFVELEWTTSLALKIDVFPIQLDGTPLPPILSAVQAFSAADIEAATLKIQRALGSHAPRATPARSQAVIEGLDSIESREPQEVLHAARSVFRQNNWTVEGSVFQAGGDIHVAFGGAPSLGTPPKTWAEKWQVWMGLLVALLTVITLGKQLIVTSPTETKQAEPDDAALLAAVKPGAVRIESGGNFVGGGLFIRGSGAVLTTAYLAERLGTDDIRVKLSNGSRLSARVATIDKAADVAVLTTEAGGTVTALKLSLAPVSQGDDVIAFVQSTDEEWQTIRGTVSRVGVDTPIGEGRIEVDIAESVGSPVVNRRGEVIGVMQGSWKDKPGYSFLIPVSVIQAQLANGASALKSPPKQ
jgi:hypothetical protein